MFYGAAVYRQSVDRTPLGKRLLGRLVSGAIWGFILYIFLTRFSFSPTPPHVRSMFTLPYGWAVDGFGIELAANSLTPGFVVSASPIDNDYASRNYYNIEPTVDIVVMSFASEAEAVAQFDARVARFYDVTGKSSRESADRRSALGNRYFKGEYIIRGPHFPRGWIEYVIQACGSVLTYRIAPLPADLRWSVSQAEKALTKFACP